jgi:hypothetical protein
MVPGDLDFPLPSLRFVPLKSLVPPARLADRAEPLDRKDLWLRSLIEQKQARRQVRFCEESTVLFDE